jgi:serine/threonine protein kinase/Tol biopolymer transport system component
VSVPSWPELEGLFHEALSRVPAERAAFLAARCAGRPELQAQIESMLRAHDEAAASALETPAAPLTRLAPGARIGSYQVLGELGAGGMGQVYRARDTRLRRDVAIKILPPIFATDPERLARFEREAHMLAALHHSNIATIFGVEEADAALTSSGQALRALILELVEGETLADRLARGPIPVTDALQMSRQIADALEAAHEKGIVHRDLKPANIKITPDGTVKVLDFGLAKMTAGDASVPYPPETATITRGGTREGVILGTAAYMSPEQARGQATDKRTDIWAFGGVLYEMLTGRPAFPGDTISDTIAAVLEREPDWAALPAAIPLKVRDLLHRCMRKDPKRRLHDIADARIEIEEAEANVDPGSIFGQDRAVIHKTRWSPAWIVAALAAMVSVVAVTVAILLVFRQLPPPQELRLDISSPPTADPLSLALSPDGQKLVFVADSEGMSRLWLRELNAVSPRPLPGSDGAAFPFWSPDSRSIGFFAEGNLKRLDLAGGAAQVLAGAPIGRGGTWNRDGVILFAPNTANVVFRVSATGGEAVAVTSLDMPQPDQVGHRFPHFLPDGRHFLFHVVGSPQYRGVYVASLDQPGKQRLLDTESAAVAASGRIFFVQQGTLFAQGFDMDRLALVGSPLSIAEHVAFTTGLNLAAISSSAAGPLAYRTGDAGGQRQFLWFNRSGEQVGHIGDPDPESPNHPELSPDGRRVALNRTMNGNADIWLFETRSGVLSRFTFDRVLDAYPVWSPDMRRLVFGSNRTGVVDLYEKPANGVGVENLLLATPQSKAPLDWSPDGRFLLYRVELRATTYDLWALPLDGDRKPFPVVQTNFDERDGQFSPDGRWIAYESNESGRFEIYVQSFPGRGGKWQMSATGCAQVRWRRDGKELFCIGLDGRLMAVPFRVGSDGQTVEPSNPVALFAARIPGGAIQGSFKHQYAVSPDGQRFLINSQIATAASPITLVLNWSRGPSE